MWLFVGQVLTRQNIEDVIEFAERENLFILADEVCTGCGVCYHVYIVFVKTQTLDLKVHVFVSMSNIFFKTD